MPGTLSPPTRTATVLALAATLLAATGFHNEVSAASVVLRLVDQGFLQEPGSPPPTVAENCQIANSCAAFLVKHLDASGSPVDVTVRIDPTLEIPFNPATGTFASQCEFRVGPFFVPDGSTVRIIATEGVIIRTCERTLDAMLVPGPGTLTLTLFATGSDCSANFSKAG